MGLFSEVCFYFMKGDLRDCLLHSLTHAVQYGDRFIVLWFSWRGFGWPGLLDDTIRDAVSGDCERRTIFLLICVARFVQFILFQPKLLFFSFFFFAYIFCKLCLLLALINTPKILEIGIGNRYFYNLSNTLEILLSLTSLRFFFTLHTDHIIILSDFPYLKKLNCQ